MTKWHNNRMRFFFKRPSNEIEFDFESFFPLVADKFQNPLMNFQARQTFSTPKKCRHEMNDQKSVMKCNISLVKRSASTRFIRRALFLRDAQPTRTFPVIHWFLFSVFLPMQLNISCALNETTFKRISFFIQKTKHKFVFIEHFSFQFFFCCSSNVVSQWSTEIVWKYSCVSSINRSIRLKTIRCGFAWRTWTNQNLHVRRCFRFNSLPFWPAQATSIHWSIIFSELKSILILRSWKKGQNILLRRRQRRMFALKFWTRSLISKCQRTNRTTSMKEHRFNSRYNFE